MSSEASSAANIFDEQQIINDGKNKEDITLIWFDPCFQSCKDSERTIRRLRLINDYIIFSDSPSECLVRIKSLNKDIIFLITSAEKASQILPETSSLDQIYCIFIFSQVKAQNEDLSTKYPNVIGIYNDFEDLCKSIQEQINLLDIPTFDVIDEANILTLYLTKDSAQVLWFQFIYQALACLPQHPLTREKIIQQCQQYYDGNVKRIEAIYDFEENYQSKDSIAWYLKQSFPYKFINKALRAHDIHLLYMFRFFIDDLSESLKREYDKLLSLQDKMLVVYRGMILHKKEFKKLKENQGKFLSTNGYFIANRSKEFALNVAQRKPKKIDMVSVLFHIRCNVEQSDNNVLFAVINHINENQDQRVLFDLNACFQIESIEEDDSLCIVKLNLSNHGQQLVKLFMENLANITDKMGVPIILGRLLRDMHEYEIALKYFQGLCNSLKDNDAAALEYQIGTIYKRQNEFSKALKYYDRAYDLMIKAKPPRIKDCALLFKQIGHILFLEKKYDEALSYHQKAIAIHETCQLPNDAGFASMLYEMSHIFCFQYRYDEALKLRFQALEIRRNLSPSGDLQVIFLLTQIGDIYYKRYTYDKALQYFKEALKISCYLKQYNHCYTVTSLQNIGYIYYFQQDDDQAMYYLEQALKISKEFYSHDINNISSLSRLLNSLYQKKKNPIK